MKTDNAIADKSKAFALRIIKLYKYLSEGKREYVLSKQLLRSGTSIGANVREALRAQSRSDFISKLEISLKEASETAYWIELLHESGYMDEAGFKSVYTDCMENIKLLTSIIITSKKNTEQSII